MTSKELVRKAIHFQGPERVPLWFHSEVYDMTNDIGLSESKTFTMLPERELRKRVPDFPGTLTQTEWGTIRGKLSTNLSTTEPIAPAFNNWEELKTYKFPDIDALYRHQKAKQKLAKDKLNKYHLAWFGNFYVSALYGCRTMQLFLEDIALYPNKLVEFCGRLESIYFRCLENWAAAGTDGIFYGEDLGLQDRLMMNPRTWRLIFKPFYIRFFEKAHSLGLDVLMHSCGYIYEIIPDLIEIGLDVLQFDQPRIFGIEKLSKEFGGKICFFCPIDIQTIMPTGDEDKIRAEAKLMVEMLGKFNGGFMGKDYAQWEDIGISDEWAKWARDTFIEFGRYR